MRFSESIFENTRVDLDSNQFVKCTFKNCVLIYNGSGPVGLENCGFHNVNWEFSGYAGNTLAFMQGMYNGSGLSGKKLIEDIFNQIRFSELVTTG